MVGDQNWNDFINGDKQSLVNIYERYYRQLYSFGIRVHTDPDLVKDLIHEIFCELWEKRTAQPRVDNVRAYLFTYLKRKIIRSIKLAPDSVQTDTAEHLMPHVPSYEEMLIRLQDNDALKDKLATCLQKLTKTQMEVLKLKYYDNLEYHEIASLMGIQPRTAYNTVFEALKTLRRYMRIIILILLMPPNPHL